MKSLEFFISLIATVGGQLIQFFPTKHKLTSLGALLPLFPLPSCNMNVKSRSAASMLIIMTYKAICQGQGSRKPEELWDIDDFVELLCLQGPLWQPNLSSLTKEWFTFVMAVSSLLIDFSNHCTKIVLEKIAPNFITSFQLT